MELEGVPFPSGQDWDLNDPVHLAALSRVITSFSVNGTNVDILRSKLDEDIETGSFDSRPFNPALSSVIFSRAGQIVAIDGPWPTEHARRSRSCSYLGPAENGASRLYDELPGDDFDIGKALRARRLSFEADFGSVTGRYMAIFRGDVLGEILVQPAPDIFYLDVSYRLKE